MSTSDLGHRINSTTLPKLPHSLPVFPDRMHAVTALLQSNHSNANSCCVVCSWHLVVALLTEEQQATSQAQGVMWPVLREQCSCATHKERHPTAQIRLACCARCESVSVPINRSHQLLSHVMCLVMVVEATPLATKNATNSEILCGSSSTCVDTCESGCGFPIPPLPNT
jgi:hypothetical protein